jgi:hypothetical protein
MKSLTLALGLAVLGAVLAAQPAAAADKSCSAVTFRGLPPGASDGKQTEAGLYKAHFGTITIDGAMKSGQATDYAIAVKGKTLDPVTSFPAPVESCLKEKKLTVPAAATAAACTGEKLKLVIVTDGAKRDLVLYAGAPGSWSYCRTSVYGG